MSRRATFVGGAQDGQRIAVGSGSLPANLVLDGEAYRLQPLTWGARYIPTRRAWGARRPFDAEARAGFLNALAGGLTVARAAELVGFSCSPVYTALHRDASFRLAYAAAQEQKRSKTPNDSTVLTVRVAPDRLAVLDDQAVRMGLDGAREVLESAVRGQMWRSDVVEVKP